MKIWILFWMFTLMTIWSFIDMNLLGYTGWSISTIIIFKIIRHNKECDMVSENVGMNEKHFFVEDDQMAQKVQP